MADPRKQEVNAIETYCQGLGLDVGCGHQKIKSDAIGFDKVPKGGRTEPYGYVSVADVVGDAYHLPFKSETFDYVAGSHCLEHLGDPSAALRDWVRVLKPGGYLLTITPLGRFTRGMDKTHIYDDLTEQDIHRIVTEGTGCEPVQFDTLKNNWSCDLVIQKPPQGIEIPTGEAEMGDREFVDSGTNESSQGLTKWNPAESLALTSVIIPSYNITQEQLDITRRCLDNIRRLTKLPYELILVDNGSTVGQDALYDQADLYLRNKENLGCAKAWNQGIKVAQGEYICIMNNDLLIFENWLDGLIGTLESHPEFAVVGPDVLQHVGCDDPDDAEVMARELSKDNYFLFTERGDGWGALFLARRTLYDELGLFDENFQYGMFEDRDFWIRVHDAGYKIVRTQRTWCFHVGNMTWGKLPNQEEIYRKNKEYFESKHGLGDEAAKIAQPARKRIAVLTTFSSFTPAYSLTGIVKDQLNVLAKNGYDVALFTLTNFEEETHCDCRVEKCIPVYKLTDYQLDVPKQPDFEEQAAEIEDALLPKLGDYDVVLTHDIMFQTWFLPHNQAVRNCGAKLPKVRWLHWQHSAPSEPPEEEPPYPHNLRFQGMPNSTYIFLNHWDVPRVARMYNIPDSDIRVVYNPKDPRTFFDLDDVTSSLIQKYSLLDCDVLCVYPTRMNPAKQPDKAMKIIAKISKHGFNAKIVFCNSFSNAKHEIDYIRELKRTARAWGLRWDDMIFTSEEGHPLGVPPRVVRELLQIANVFILPSISEACSLVFLEAALTKNLVVLNDDFPPLRGVGEENALYFKFSSTLFKTSYKPSEETYIEECAKRIIAELNTNKSLGLFKKIKQKFNADYIFKHQLEPLFYEP